MSESFSEMVQQHQGGCWGRPGALQGKCTWPSLFNQPPLDRSPEPGQASPELMPEGLATSWSWQACSLLTEHTRPGQVSGIRSTSGHQEWPLCGALAGRRTAWARLSCPWTAPTGDHTCLCLDWKAHSCRLCGRSSVSSKNLVPVLREQAKPTAVL